MKKIAFFIVLAFGIPGVQAQQNALEYFNAKASYYNVGEDKVGVQGYDLVEYHISQKAVKGTEKYSAVFDGVVYYFQNQSNKNSFSESPKKYIPAYGGYCAYGLGMEAGQYSPGKYPVNPESFKIINGKLYLFYLTPEYSALENWNRDETQLLKKADLLWEEIGSPDDQ